MEKNIITLHIDKTTKNTVRYEQEVGEGEKEIIPTVYVKNTTFKGTPPQRIQITIENAPED